LLTSAAAEEEVDVKKEREELSADAAGVE